MMAVCSECSAELCTDTNKFLVCEECGFVPDQTILCDDQFPKQVETKNNFCFGSKRPFYLKSKHYKRLPEATSQCVGLAHSMCCALGCPSSMTQEAKNMVKRVFNDETFNKKHLGVKKTITVCCVYFVCRSRNWSVTFSDLQKYSDNTHPNFEHWKSQLVIRFPEFTESSKKIDIHELAMLRCKTLDFDKMLTSTVIDILKLANNVWLVDGSKPDMLIYSACYLAWVSADLQERAKTKISQFCKIHKLHSMNKTICKGASIITKALKQLAEQIPWFEPEQETTGLKVLSYLQDILSFQKILISGAVNRIKEEGQEDVKQFQNEDIHPHKRPGSDDIEAYQIRKRARVAKKVPECNEVDESAIVIPKDLDMSREELDENDIDDETLHLYIRKSDEVLVWLSANEMSG